jgi:glutathione peroxidase
MIQIAKATFIQASALLPWLVPLLLRRAAVARYQPMNTVSGGRMTNVHHFKVTTSAGELLDLSQFRDKVLLIVNTASQCGFTPQYQELEQLHQQFADQGLVILAFPCNQFGGQEPATNQEIQQFCQLNFGVSFPVMAKIQVNGPEAEPLFEYLKDQARGLMKTRAIKWNFTKFLVNKNGVVVKRYAPRTKPSQFVQAIAEELALLPQSTVEVAAVCE